MKAILAFVCVLFLLFIPIFADGDADKLIGVWERVSLENLDTGESNTYPLRLIITEKFWSVSLPDPVLVKLSKSVDEMTKEELLNRLIFCWRQSKSEAGGSLKV